MLGRVLIALLLMSSSVCARLYVAFSPSTECEQKIIDLINNSQSKIDIAVYAINNHNIVSAIKKAHSRGIKIRILTDKLQASGKYSKVLDLHQSGLHLKVNAVYKTEHNKFAIFDQNKVVTGSYNWTNSATHKNSENCLFIADDSLIVQKYQTRFDYLWNLAVDII